MNIDEPSQQRRVRDPRAMKWLLASVLGFLACSWYALTQAPAPVGVDWSHHASFWQPSERNAFLRLPSTGRVHGLVFSADRKHGWAMSSLDTLLATDDGGATWSALSRGVTGATRLAFTDDGRTGWALGPAMLRRTRDGGRQWTAVADPAFHGQQWTTLAFSGNGQAGIVGGVNGVMVVTGDGGARWTLVPAASARLAGTVKAAAWSTDGVNGWVVGDGGLVRVTADGGKNWTLGQRGLPPYIDLIQVHFLADGLHGWVVGSDGTVYASANGGRAWQPVALVAGYPIADIGFADDAKHGWAIATDNALLITTDGGAHWQVRGSLGAMPQRYLAVAPDGGRLWVSGSRGIAASDNGGATWQAQTRDALRPVQALAFARDGQQGWAVGRSGMLIHSTDGGATWTAQVSGTPNRLQGLAVHPDGQKLWAAGGIGTVLRSTDGGRHWIRTALATTEDLIRVAFWDDGKRGVLLGARGALWHSVNGGETWSVAQGNIAPEDSADLVVLDKGKDLWVATLYGHLLRSRNGGKTWAQALPGEFPHGLPAETAVPVLVAMNGPIALPHFTADGKHGWTTAGAPDCKTWLTSDSGVTWDPVPLPPAGSFPCEASVAWFQQEGPQGWILGSDQPLLASEDNGRHWEKAWLPYRRLPGPWYWCALLPIGACLLMFVRRGHPPKHSDSAAGMFVDDDAITAFDDDRLDFSPLARGLSRFLRNAKTSPPLTLAIIGDWGTGKSSLMRLLCADLRRHGQRPIWFNAWHHQKDEQLFSALLGTIQAQAAPSSWRPAGWIFRLKLLWTRSKRHFFLSGVALMVATSLAAFRWQYSTRELGIALTQLAKAPAWLKGLGSMPATGLELGHVGVLAQLAAVLTAARLLYKGMQSFGVNPALMFKGMSEHVSLKQANAQNNFRTTFARQFEEVADALPYRLTIVVDDLDRCRPENILELLETVNFLTASGRCFVVFGMARERVLAALSMAFEKIADELAEEQDAAILSAKARRRAYASDYLEKLINLEIMVPQRGDIGAHALFAGGAARPPSAVHQACLKLGAMWPLWAASLAVCAGIAMSGMAYRSTQAMQSITIPVLDAPGAGPGATVTPMIPATVQPEPEPQVVPSALLPGFEAGDTAAWSTTWGPLLLIALLMLLALAAHALLRLRGQVLEVRDSPAFLHGLAVWTDLAALRRDTPRSIKRWGNRLRYFAMLQQGSAVEETRGQRIRRKLRTRLQEFGKGRATWWQRVCGKLADQLPAPAPGPVSLHHTVIDEGRLVAIGAAHEAYGNGWLNKLNGAATLPAGDPLKQALRRYRDIAKDAWRDISHDEAEAFERLLAGIKLPPASVDDGPGVRPAPHRQSAPPSMSSDVA